MEGYGDLQASAGNKLDVVTTCDESVDERRANSFDAAVATRGNGQPRWYHLQDREGPERSGRW